MKTGLNQQMFVFSAVRQNSIMFTKSRKWNYRRFYSMFVWTWIEKRKYSSNYLLVITGCLVTARLLYFAAYATCQTEMTDVLKEHRSITDGIFPPKKSVVRLMNLILFALLCCWILLAVTAIICAILHTNKYAWFWNFRYL